MSYLFNTTGERQDMLDAVGAASIDELFAMIPDEVQLNRPLRLPPPLTEIDLQRHMTAAAAGNTSPTDAPCFIGGGAYEHFIPAVVDEICSRGEYYTSYTPYQSEAGQGSLQAFFEFQSLICRLTGLPVANASLYEGATSISEAAFMAMRVTGRYDKVAVLQTVHPESRQVLETLLSGLSTELVTIPSRNGVTDLQDIAGLLDARTACLIIQQPNFLGTIEDAAALCELAASQGVMSVVSFDPISLGLLPRPGDYGADIAVAEGQSLGIPLQYGGPYLGLMACREEFVRKMPGRLVGQTIDQNGKTCYVLNLQAREQHIRRDKATSNICTNQGLMALRATVHLSSLGPQGLREVAELSCRKAHDTADKLQHIDGVSLPSSRPFFKEFCVETPFPSTNVLTGLRERGFLAGPALSRLTMAKPLSPHESRRFLIAVTECRTLDEIDRFVAAFADVMTTLGRSAGGTSTPSPESSVMVNP